jgi:peptide/nickel transport system permease protein
MLDTVPTFEETTRKKHAGIIRRTRIIQNITLIVPATILALMVIIAIFADLSWLGLPDVGLSPHDPDHITMTDRFLPPAFMEGGKSEYLLGTDKLGRDILSRIIHGSRISLSISMLVISITALIGTALGIIAGYAKGRTDGFIMRVTDVALSFPALLLAMLLAVAIEPGYWTQARVCGASPWRIMLRHIFPNVVNSLVVMMTLSVGMVILAEAALSFLGVGVPAPTASWGSMVNDGRGYLATALWISAFPGIAIGLVVMAGNFLGDWIRDKLDPRLREI